jgi:hypothetical protein
MEMIKLKELIKESKYAFGRKFGEPLPTIETTTERHKVNINERNPDAELYKKLGKIGTDVGNLVKKYEKMADTDKALSTFMVGLHSMLVKMGYKRFK